MKTIAICNLAAGTGKTSVAVQLAATIAAQRDQGVVPTRTLLVDLDPTGAATQWLLGDDGFGVRGGGADALETGRIDPAEVLAIEGYEIDVADFVRGTSSFTRLEILPASVQLATTEQRLAGEIGRECMLRTALAGAGNTAETDWDLVLLDCPSHLGAIMLNALAAADHVIVPVTESNPGAIGLAAIRSAIDDIGARLGGRADVLGLLPFGAEDDVFWKHFRSELQKGGVDVLDASISASDASRTHVRAGTTVGTAPDTDSRATFEYRDLLAELAIKRPDSFMPRGFREAMLEFVRGTVKEYGVLEAVEQRE